MSANKLFQVEFVMQLEGNALSINKVILELTLLLISISLEAFPKARSRIHANG